MSQVKKYFSYKETPPGKLYIINENYKLVYNNVEEWSDNIHYRFAPEFVFKNFKKINLEPWEIVKYKLEGKWNE